MILCKYPYIYNIYIIAYAYIPLKEGIINDIHDNVSHYLK